MRKWRKKADLSQEAAAALVSVDQSTWARWERGTVQPSLDQAVRIQEISKGEMPVHMWKRSNASKLRATRARTGTDG